MTRKECGTGVVRRYRSRSEAAALVAEFAASGLTRREFCERNDVSLNTLHRYMNRHRHANSEDAHQLIGIDVARPAGFHAELAVVLRHDRKIEKAKGVKAQPHVPVHIIVPRSFFAR